MLTTFIATMSAFGDATGLTLNPNKAEILLIGNLAESPDPQIDSADAGNGTIIQVVKQMTISSVLMGAP